MKGKSARRQRRRGSLAWPLLNSTSTFCSSCSTTFFASASPPSPSPPSIAWLRLPVPGCGRGWHCGRRCPPQPAGAPRAAPTSAPRPAQPRAGPGRSLRERACGVPRRRGAAPGAGGVRRVSAASPAHPTRLPRPGTAAEWDTAGPTTLARHGHRAGECRPARAATRVT